MPDEPEDSEDFELGFYVDTPRPVPAVEALPNGIRHAKKRAFLAAFCELGNLSEAAKAAGCHRTMHNHWLSTDEKYVAAFAQAEEIAADYLESEARRRATQGVLEPVYYQGKKVGHIRRYSDTLLIFLLKGARPEKYRDNATIRHTGPGGAALEADYALARSMAADPEALALSMALAAKVLEDQTKGELPAPIPVDSEEVTDK